ncbi:MAG: galactose mutarotase [Defluviitaleaceae bacterium]|nr:galactose mutarotase [Defluviitaleaceae bacterium]MCL2239109.1 galactose mutarotase [Defluviitaleaceae bacterium]
MEIKTFELSNQSGMTVTVTNVGCAIISLKVPDKNGQPRDVVLGLDKAEDYLGKHFYLGVIIGRVGNRIGYGKFTLDGKEYQLATNDGKQHLHGGVEGFDKKIWTVEESGPAKIVFSYVSPDGEENYPGRLAVRCTYTLSQDNTLRIDYFAETDTKTICNLTNHSYFNLEGYDAKDIYGHVMQINADQLTAVDEALIPTGAFAPVAGTPFDFNAPKPIGQDIEKAGAVNSTGGFDHNYVLNGKAPAASVYAPGSGVKMTVTTDMPGMQFYSGNFIDGAVTGKGVTYQKHSGFCLETQLYPDTINQPHFPSCVVTPDKPFRSFTAFKFEK